MPEIYADWKSLEPLTATVPVGTKCVVIDRDERDKFALGEIVITQSQSDKLPWCVNADGVREIMRITELAILPADYQAKPKAKPKAKRPAPAKPERKIIAMASVVVHGHYEIHAVCNDGTMWVNDLNYPSWTRSRLNSIPQD